MRNTGLSVVLLSLMLWLACSSGADQSETENIGEEMDQREFAERMSREHAGDVPDASPLATLEPSMAVDAELVEYGTASDGTPIRGYLAQPSGSASNLPGIIVIHEWWGLNDNIEAMTRLLAGEGYQALAVDLYGDVATEPDGARALMDAVDETEAEANLARAVGFLREAGAPAIGVIGWCFGGGWSLATALQLPDEIDATVIYYGRLETDPERLATLGMPILGHFGSEDRGIPVDLVRRFETTLDSLGANATVHVYEPADHGFANPSGTRYQAEAADSAWARTVRFFDGNLR